MPATTVSHYTTTITYHLLHGSPSVVVQTSLDRMINVDGKLYPSIFWANSYGNLYKLASDGIIGVVESSGDMYDCESFYLLDNSAAESQSYDLSYLETIKQNNVEIFPTVGCCHEDIYLCFTAIARKLQHDPAKASHRIVEGSTIKTALANLDRYFFRTARSCPLVDSPTYEALDLDTLFDGLELSDLLTGDQLASAQQAQHSI